LFFNKIPLAGPWLLPAMLSKGITNKNEQQKIVMYFVDAFNSLLKSLDKKHLFFHHIDLTKNFLEEREWHNEIHLNNSGFNQVAKRYNLKIEEILNYNPLQKYRGDLIL